MHQPECKELDMVINITQFQIWISHKHCNYCMFNIFWNNWKDFKKSIKENKTFDYVSRHTFWFKCSLFSKSCYTWSNWVPQHLLFGIITCNLIHITVRLMSQTECHLPGLTDTVVEIQWNCLWKLFRKQKLHLQWVWNIPDTEYIYTCIQRYAYLYWFLHQFCYHSWFFFLAKE